MKDNILEFKKKEETPTGEDAYDALSSSFNLVLQLCEQGELDSLCLIFSSEALDSDGVIALGISDDDITALISRMDALKANLQGKLDG